MGFTVYYRTFEPVDPQLQAAITKLAEEKCRGRTWLSCEPVGFFAPTDGHLLGGSKPNFLPDPEDAASAAEEGLPDGTLRDAIDILCGLSRELGVDWEISHDHSDGVVGYIRRGECDDDLRNQLAEIEELVQAMQEMGLD